MTGEAAVRLNKYSEVRESIYGKHVRSSDMLLTGLIYGCTAVSLLILGGHSGIYICKRDSSCDLVFLKHCFQCGPREPLVFWEILLIRST